MDTFITVALVVVALALVAALVYVTRKGIVNVSDLPTIGNAFEAVLNGIKDALSSKDKSTVDRLIDLVWHAIYAAEQMSKTGKINPEEKKRTALDIVENLAAVDGIEVSAPVMTAVSDLIEAGVKMMNDNQKPEEANVGDALAASKQTIKEAIEEALVAITVEVVPEDAPGVIIKPPEADND